MAELVDSYVKLLLPFDGDDAATVAIDHSGENHVLTFVGDAQLDTAQKKFGPTSLLLPGTGDYLTTPDSPSWAFGAGNFTIDFWKRFASVAVNQAFIGQLTDTGVVNFWDLYWNTATNKLYAWAKVNDVYTLQSDINWNPSTNTWYHIAYVRDGANIYIFINGISQALNVTTPIGANSFPDVADVLEIGAIRAHAIVANGWMDMLRISKGVARWTANFTPYTYPYHRIAEAREF